VDVWICAARVFSRGIFRISRPIKWSILLPNFKIYVILGIRIITLNLQGRAIFSTLSSFIRKNSKLKKANIILIKDKRNDMEKIKRNKECKVLLANKKMGMIKNCAILFLHYKMEMKRKCKLPSSPQKMEKKTIYTLSPVKKWE